MYFKVNQTKTNLHKYFLPSFLNQLIYAHVQCQESKKVSKRLLFKRRRQGFAPLEVITLWWKCSRSTLKKWTCYYLSGMYICTADNGVGQPSSAEIDLQVLCKLLLAYYISELSRHEESLLFLDSLLWYTDRWMNNHFGTLHLLSLPGIIFTSTGWYKCIKVVSKFEDCDYMHYYR